MQHRRRDLRQRRIGLLCFIILISSLDFAFIGRRRVVLEMRPRSATNGDLARIVDDDDESLDGAVAASALRDTFHISKSDMLYIMGIAYAQCERREKDRCFHSIPILYGSAHPALDGRNVTIDEDATRLFFIYIFGFCYFSSGLRRIVSYIYIFFRWDKRRARFDLYIALMRTKESSFFFFLFSLFRMRAHRTSRVIFPSHSLSPDFSCVAVRRPPLYVMALFDHHACPSALLLQKSVTVTENDDQKRQPGTQSSG